MLRIGALEIEKGAALAPMAGVTDIAMREVCARFGAVFTVSEMVSAKALTMKDKKSFELMRGGGGAAPYGVQLFGNEPDVMGDAVKLLEQEPFDFLDLNMGCPAPKIVGHGAGSSLLKTPKLAGELAAAAVRASNRPVTAKLRIGWDDSRMTGEEVAKRCEEAGIALLAVHGRTRAQMYKPGVNFEAVARIKQAVRIPVLFNGDVVDAATARKALEQTGCDGVMVGRGAIGDPWLFEEIKAVLNGRTPPEPPGLEQRFTVMEQQVQGMCREKGEYRALREARKVAAGYVRGLRGAAALRRMAHSLEHLEDLAHLIDTAYQYQLEKPEQEKPPAGAPE